MSRGLLISTNNAGAEMIDKHLIREYIASETGDDIIIRQCLVECPRSRITPAPKKEVYH